MRAPAKRAGWRAALLALACLGLALPVVAAVVSIRADPWYPFNGDPDSDRPGYMIEIARYALAKGGHQVDYQILPWRRSLDAAERGRIDCVVGVHPVSARSLLYTEESYGRVEEAFFSRRDAPPWQYRNVGDLRDKVVAVIGGYRYGDSIDPYVAEMANTRSVYVANGEDALERNIRMLLAGRVDLVLEVPYVFNAKAKEMGVLQEVREAARLNESYDLYIACSPVRVTSDGYLRLLDAGIRELRRTGELRKILDKYGVEDWKKP